MWNIVGGLALGLSLGVVIQAYAPPKNQNMVQNQVPVVVAGTNLVPGTVLRPGALQVVQWPREALPPHTLNTLKQVEGQVVTVPVTKGEPILRPKLAPLSSHRPQPQA
jgi:pilus assembly protein CpaB